MRVLWVGDSPDRATSGYAGQAALFLTRLRAAGHQVAVFGLGWSMGRRYDLPDGTPVYPTVADGRGNDVVAQHGAHWRADVVLTLLDPHLLDPAVYVRLPWLAWAPVDFEIPTKATVRALRAAKWVWSPSQHGMTGLSAALRPGNTHWGCTVTRVPHGVDSAVFRPLDRESCREALRLPQDAKLLVTVAANKGTPSRKGFFDLFRTMKVVRDREPRALLWAHTDASGAIGGENLRDLMALADLPEDAVRFPDQYEYATGMIAPDRLAEVYSAADLYVSASHGEGFGIPLVEAQMCGLEVVCGRHTAHVDTCITGEMVKCDPYVPFDGGTIWRRPRAQALAEACLSILGRPQRAEEVRAAAMKFDADRVFKDLMLPELAKIETEVRR